METSRGFYEYQIFISMNSKSAKITLVTDRSGIRGALNVFWSFFDFLRFRWFILPVMSYQEWLTTTWTDLCAGFHPVLPSFTFFVIDGYMLNNKVLRPWLRLIIELLRCPTLCDSFFFLFWAKVWTLITRISHHTTGSVNLYFDQEIKKTCTENCWHLWQSLDIENSVCRALEMSIMFGIRELHFDYYFEDK